MTVPVRVSVREGNTPTRPEKQSHSSVGFVLQSANYVQSKPLKVDGRLLLHGMWVLRSANPVQEDQGKVNPVEILQEILQEYGRITQYDIHSLHFELN